jgi:putative Mg2+ transporter-C (MgtC) family protein
MLLATGDPWLVRLADMDHLGRTAVRLLIAAALGAVLGYEREEEGKAAGLRTHMLVSLGAALFIVASLEAGATVDQITRVIQGMVVGIGFLAGGVIFKTTTDQRVRGLTSAADLWVTSAAGMAVGLGLLWPPVIAVGLAWIILLGLRWVERWLRSRGKKKRNNFEQSEQSGNTP